MRILLILFLLFSVMGCVYQNRTKITNLAEFGGKLYIATTDGALKTYDAEKNKFESITAFKGARITKIIPTKESLIIEATRIGKDKPETYENIYFISAQGAIINSIDVVSPGFKQYESTLIAADNKYLYGLKNELIQTANKKHQFIVRSFRYDTQTKERIQYHFDEDVDLIVRDIFEDNNYYWYACYRNPVATHWTSAKGNLVVVRRDKITNEWKLIILGEDVFEQHTFITGDNKNIWVSGETWSKDNIFKISKEYLTYETLRINDLAHLIKEKPSKDPDTHLWLLLSRSYKLSLHRFDKTNLKLTQITLSESDGTISGYGPAVADDRFVWIGLSQLKPYRAGFAENYSPYLLRVSKVDLSSEVIPIKTTFSEGVNNIMRSVVGYAVNVFFGIFGGPG